MFKLLGCYSVRFGSLTLSLSNSTSAMCRQKTVAPSLLHFSWRTGLGHLVYMLLTLCLETQQTSKAHRRAILEKLYNSNRFCGLRIPASCYHQKSGIMENSPEISQER